MLYPRLLYSNLLNRCSLLPFWRTGSSMAVWPFIWIIQIRKSKILKELNKHVSKENKITHHNFFYAIAFFFFKFLHIVGWLDSTFNYSKGRYHDMCSRKYFWHASMTCYDLNMLLQHPMISISVKGELSFLFHFTFQKRTSSFDHYAIHVIVWSDNYFFQDYSF